MLLMILPARVPLNSQLQNGLSVLRHGRAKSNFLGYILVQSSLRATLGDGMNQKPSPVVLVVEDEWLLRLLAVEIVEDAGLLRSRQLTLTRPL